MKKTAIRGKDVRLSTPPEVRKKRKRKRKKEIREARANRERMISLSSTPFDGTELGNAPQPIPPASTTVEVHDSHTISPDSLEHSAVGEVSARLVQAGFGIDDCDGKLVSESRSETTTSVDGKWIVFGRPPPTKEIGTSNTKPLRSVYHDLEAHGRHPVNPVNAHK